ncbi:right-handed parallel beta-helix repeat-containing protein [Nannocystis sp. SCPEA4]|uniref:right-handed parallel beta-helix repeat-containing protein n=1 Tax=Nannocystis sp. SCPEA4 TaxID=2996787 RepID=UPI002270CF7C|nr:right-handed parallel beta-helix repeat-containing protein [Nannocystis sp. SCPEA4]MCY1053547.1 right-handed parallel beta-helix repeat-containing protein [Nannocystis sp. SCPEA4]
MRSFMGCASVALMLACGGAPAPGDGDDETAGTSGGATADTTGSASAGTTDPTGGATDGAGSTTTTTTTAPTTDAPTTGGTTADETGTTTDPTTGEPLGPCDGPRPGPDNTGVQQGVPLVPSGSITVEEDGAVIEGLDIDGTITILADDVTIRNVRIRTDDYYPIRYFDEDNVGLVVEDSEIEGLSGNATAAISFANYTARRLNIHGTADGFKADSNVLIEDCWVHDLSNGEGEHNDGVQSTGGAGVTLRHNDISGASNAAVQTGDLGGATIDLILECNWFDGGGWTLNIRGEGDTVPMGTQVIDNRFGRGHGYGPWVIDDPNPVISGNVYDDDDTPIP